MLRTVTRAGVALMLLQAALLAGCTTSGGSGEGLESGYPVSPASATASIPSNAGALLTIVKDLPPPPDTKGGMDQPIAQGDVLEVDVFQVDDLDRTVQVGSDGQISLPLIGTVEAAGKTTSTLKNEIEKAYGAKYLQSPDVTIFVKDSAGQRVTVSGAVRRAGVFPVTGNTSLVQALAQAGGFNEIADKSKVYVFRDFGSRKLVANYDVGRIEDGKLADPRVYGGDTIVAFDSATKIAGRNLRAILGGAASAVSIAGAVP